MSNYEIVKPRAFWTGPLPDYLTLQQLQTIMRTHYGHERHEHPQYSILALDYISSSHHLGPSTSGGLPLINARFRFRLVTSAETLSHIIVRHETAMDNGRESYCFELPFDTMRVCITIRSQRHSDDSDSDSQIPTPSKLPRLDSMPDLVPSRSMFVPQ